MLSCISTLRTCFARNWYSDISYYLLGWTGLRGPSTLLSSTTSKIFCILIGTRIYLCVPKTSSALNR
jgi:hypothetical protein